MLGRRSQRRRPCCGFAATLRFNDAPGHGAHYLPTEARSPAAAHRRPGGALALAFAASMSLAATLGPAPACAAATVPSGGARSHGTELQRVPGDHLMPILGKDVVSATGEKMGPIVDVLFDQAGKPRAAVIDFGGFLGVGTRKIAIDWAALLFDMGEQKNVIALDISRQQLEAAPEYKGADQPVSIVTLPRSGQSGSPPNAAR